MKQAFVLLQFLIITGFLSTTVSAQQAIPQSHLVFPVLIKGDSTGYGTGFYVRDSINVYLVTAKHNIIDRTTGRLKYKLLEIDSFNSEVRKTTLVFNLTQLAENGMLRPHNVHDVAIIRVASAPNNGIMTTSDGVRMLTSGPLRATTAKLNMLVPIDSVFVGNDVFIYGFPVAIGLKNIPQLDYQKPLLRKGIVAGLNNNSSTIIIDTFTYGGNSGGPVVQVNRIGGREEFRVIGLSVEFVPVAERWERKEDFDISNSGYSIVEPMDFVLELIKQLQE